MFLGAHCWRYLFFGCVHVARLSHNIISQRERKICVPVKLAFCYGFIRMLGREHEQRISIFISNLGRSLCNIKPRNMLFFDDIAKFEWTPKPIFAFFSSNINIEYIYVCSGRCLCHFRLRSCFYLQSNHFLFIHFFPGYTRKHHQIQC